MKAAPPILEAMRRRTRVQHERLERLTFGDRIIKGTLTPADYRRLVGWQEEAHHRLEPAVVDLQLGSYRYQPRFYRGQGKAVDFHRALGIAYVLEGSSLGGTVIHRSLLANATLEGERPFTFYAWQSEHGLRQWRTLLSELQRRPFSSEGIERAAAAAEEAFTVFERAWEDQSAESR